LEEYRQGRISHGKIGHTLGLDYWQTEQLLHERGVPLIYSQADLHDDKGFAPSCV
jgi:predicted HTH domain antitoxin